MPDDDDTLVWYFTFGGNMNRATLARREGISPVQSLPGTLEGYQLAFNTQGFDGCEPRFASIEPVDPMRGVRFHGIAHRLTLRELRILDRYEGATGPPGSTIAYDRVMAGFTPYASVVADAPASRFEIHTYVATQVHAYTVHAHRSCPPTRAHASVHGARLCCMLTHAAAQAKLVEAAPPSQRYLDLIVSGAAAIGLDETYLAWLRGHEVLPSTTYLPN